MRATVGEPSRTPAFSLRATPDTYIESSFVCLLNHSFSRVGFSRFLWGRGFKSGGGKGVTLTNAS